jgi:uroporphyrinogen III methyltransferase/synthase
MIEVLSGKTIAVTRASSQALGLTKALETRGATVLLAPTIAFVPPSEPSLLVRAKEAADAGKFQAIAFTSTNGVRAWFCAGPPVIEGPCAAIVAAVGRETAAAIREYVDIDIVTGSLFDANSLAEVLLQRLPPESRVLLVRAEEGREVLPERLRAAGHDVTVAPAYKTVAGDGPAKLAQALCAGAVDAVTFTAGSTVREAWKALTPDAQAALKRVPLASIGPATSAVLGELGLPVAVEASPYTAEGLVNALVAYFASTSNRSPRAPSTGDLLK